jgi:hypothetical protein
MNLQEIVKKYLEENGYDGLCDSDTECACRLDDLMPCGEPGICCEAGHLTKPPEGVDYADWWLAPGPRPENSGSGR